jgi:hypothetical protein
MNEEENNEENLQQLMNQEICNAKNILKNLEVERQVLWEEIQELRKQKVHEEDQKRRAISAAQKRTIEIIKPIETRTEENASQKSILKNRSKSVETTPTTKTEINLNERQPSRLYRSLTNLLRFDGGGDINEFIIDKRRIAKVYYWSESEEKEIAIYHLDGEAIKYAESLSYKLNIDEFYNSLKTKYQSDHINDNITFRNLTPETNETFRHFAQRLNEACEKIFKSLNEQEKVQTMLRKIS